MIKIEEVMNINYPDSVSKYEITSWVLTGLFLMLILVFKLLPALLGGLLVYELVHIMTPRIAQHFPNFIPWKYTKFWAVGILAVFIVSMLILAGAGVMTFFRSEAGSITVLLAKLAQIIEDSRKILPVWVFDYLPEDAMAFKEHMSSWLRTHANSLQSVGTDAIRGTAHVLIGMVVGGMVAVREVVNMNYFKPFAHALVCRASLLSEAFRRFVFAQLRIATINAIFTGIYLAVVLPMMGIQLPLVKTLIALTFVIGLIPVLGNLISNSIIVIVSLSHSVAIAIGSLVYLVVIHKFEYFLNARIVGGQIRAYAWEILIAMILMEAVFGIVGVIAAPIYYAYLKLELRERELV
jgi:predicted PurR-regulated permease PerM